MLIFCNVDLGTLETHILGTFDLVVVQGHLWGHLVHFFSKWPVPQIWLVRDLNFDLLRSNDVFVS